jgi:superfamily II DNA or RNA helicase
MAGDYHEGDLAEAVNKATLVASVVETWQVRGGNRPTLCFAVDRAHAKHLQTQFQAAGISAEYIDAYTEAFERAAIAKRFHAGEVKVVCNVGCLTTASTGTSVASSWRGPPRARCSTFR